MRDEEIQSAVEDALGEVEATVKMLTGAVESEDYETVLMWANTLSEDADALRDAAANAWDHEQETADEGAEPG